MVLLPLLASGCVGYVAYLPQERVVAPLQLSKAAHLPRPELTREQLLLYQGEPSRKHTDGEDETWIYDGAREWVGVALVLAAPLPLMLPVARDRLEVRFRGERAVSARVSTVDEHGLLCGVLPGHDPCTWWMGCDRH